MPNDQQPIALALSRVSVRFEDSAEDALRDISFSISKGAFISFVGPSGAGKSTLMRVILGLMPAHKGTVVRHYNKSAMVFQNYALFPWLTTLGNATFGLRMSGMDKAEREKIGREKLQEVGLAGFESHYPAQLSGGQRQRVSIARALAVTPDLLVMDEPFSNLDTITANELKADILKLWRQYGMTILMVNHLVPDAIELSDAVFIMSANPGEIKKTLPIDLPRPRNDREPRFFEYVDELTNELRSA